MWMSWQVALQIAMVLVVAVIALARVARPWAAKVAAVAREAALVLSLYALWQYAHDLAINKVDGAIDNARWVWDLEQWMHLPSELSVQQALIDHRWIMQFLNVYYGGMHVPAIGALLLWLFFRHRDRYPRVRTSLAMMIGGCLLIQMIPVAPPRFLPDLGFVDAGLVYGMSVYGAGGSGVSNQLAAMPSHHVGWSLLVAIAVISISTSRWRWWVLAHPVLTVLAVVATANHWWLDGVVAGMVLAVAYGIQRGLQATSEALSARGWGLRLRRVGPSA
jgi:hypothetical protein